MAALPWYRMWTNFPDHEKTLALCDAVRDDNAGMYLVRLHSHCAREALDGRVRASAVEGVCRWRKRRGALLDALTATGWVEPQGDGTVVVHGWEERNGSHIRKALSDAQKPRGNKPKARANPAAVPPPSRERPAAVPLGTVAGPAVGDGRSETVDRSEDALSPALTHEGESPDLVPVAADVAPPPAAEAAAGTSTAVTGTALPAAPEEAPASDPAPSPAGHSAEGDPSGTAARCWPPRLPLGLDEDIPTPPLEVLDLVTDPRGAGAAARAEILAGPAGRYPLTGELLEELWRRGWEAAAWPKESARAAVESAVRQVGVTVAAERLLAQVERDRALRVVTRPWLGWHLDTIAGADTSPRAKAGSIRVGSVGPAPHESFGEGGRRVIE